MNSTLEKLPGPEYAIPPDARIQDQINKAVYFSGNVYLYYQFTGIMPVEAACFAKYGEHLKGRDLLDIGTGTGRTTRHLAPLVRRYEAIDYSPVMVNYVRKHFPKISVRQADFRDLSMFEDASFDFILATANIIDALPHEGRLSALNEARRVLRRGGILAFSSHNLSYEHAYSGPKMRWSWNPLKLGFNVVKFGLGSWNNRRVGPMRRDMPDYSLLNDTGHFYSCLHYYVARPVVDRQLANAGLQLRDVYDGIGHPLTENADHSKDPWLFYVAQK